MATATVDDITRRLVHEYNEQYDRWQRDGRRGSLTAQAQPIIVEACVDLLRTVGLTLLGPQDLALAKAHMQGIVQNCMFNGQPSGPLNHDAIDWDLLRVHMRRLR